MRRNWTGAAESERMLLPRHDPMRMSLSFPRERTWRKLIVRLLVLLTVAEVADPCSYSKGQERDAAKKLVRLRIEVTAAESGHPLEGAQVTLRYSREGLSSSEKPREVNGKTDKEGVFAPPPVPSGKASVEVTAAGRKTHLRWYEIAKDNGVLSIRLEPLARWQPGKTPK
jgi:hypothetical protein